MLRVRAAAARRGSWSRTGAGPQDVDAREPGEQADEPGSARWHELFDETPHTRPVDFHSFRRAYAQALADADVSAQQAAALAGHADLGAHLRYLMNTSKTRRLPERALPDLRVVESSATRPIQVPQRLRSASN